MNIKIALGCYRMDSFTYQRTIIDQQQCWGWKRMQDALQIFYNYFLIIFLYCSCWANCITHLMDILQFFSSSFLSIAWALQFNYCLWLSDFWIEWALKQGINKIDWNNLLLEFLQTKLLKHLKQDIDIYLDNPHIWFNAFQPPTYFFIVNKKTIESITFLWNQILDNISVNFEILLLFDQCFNILVNSDFWNIIKLSSPLLWNQTAEILCEIMFS